MSTPAPSFSNRQEFRDSNRRMAGDILAAEPAQIERAADAVAVFELKPVRADTDR